MTESEARRLGLLDGKRKKRKRRPAQPPKVPPVFARMLSDAGLPQPVPEHRFHPVRRWRFDFAWPDKLLALEVEGGVFSGGRHTRGVGYKADCEKYSKAAAMGWRILRVTPDQLATEATVALIKEAMGND